MIIEALQPLKITTKTLGAVSMNVGDRLTWPDKAVEMLLEKFPDKLKVVGANHKGFYVGQTVRYRIPIVQSATRYSWDWHIGIVQAIDHHHKRVTIIPETEDQPWRIMAWEYCVDGETE